ncbi:hypothetical protein VTN77DRAFT_8317 [Rasamsonia byssochlamydoides]|uniref:uncharacterized protein n=1 Tax=Rasamsonia byssochlamydoides TaxID=89139 RepID=UPI0037429053
MVPMTNNTYKEATVEDVQDEAEVANTDSWSEMLSQHESSLSSHLDLVNTLKDRVGQDDDASQTISSIIDSAKRLIEQFAVIKKQFIALSGNQSIQPDGGEKDVREQPRRKIKAMKSRKGPIRSAGKESATGESEPLNAQNGNGRPSPSTTSSGETPGSLPQKLWPGQKRTWTEEDSEAPETANPLQKRQRTRRSIPGADDDVKDVIPVAMQTEDISDEVERRLKLKEERRRKWNSRPEKKRKRDSMEGSQTSKKQRTVSEDGDSKS